MWGRMRWRLEWPSWAHFKGRFTLRGVCRGSIGWWCLCIQVICLNHIRVRLGRACIIIWRPRWRLMVGGGPGGEAYDLGTDDDVCGRDGSGVGNCWEGVAEPEPVGFGETMGVQKRFFCGHGPSALANERHLFLCGAILKPRASYLILILNFLSSNSQPTMDYSHGVLRPMCLPFFPQLCKQLGPFLVDKMKLIEMIVHKSWTAMLILFSNPDTVAKPPCCICWSDFIGLLPHSVLKLIVQIFFLYPSKR